MKAETVTFTKVVEIADADGAAIREGSVLREITDGERGVVRRIIRVGDRGSVIDCIGDVQIQTAIGCTRVTNRYNQWRHIPHNQQTYKERYWSWLSTPYDHESKMLQVSKEEGLAIDGIMALLPDDVVDYDYGPFPDTLDEALNFLVTHLSKLAQPTEPSGGRRRER